MKERPILKYGALLTSLLLCLSLSLAACSGSGTDLPPTGDQTLVIRITGDSGLPFSGSYVTVKADGNIETGQLEGTAPRDFPVEGMQVDVTVKKTTATGYLKVQILRGRTAVAEGEITASFGSVVLSGR